MCTEEFEKLKGNKGKKEDQPNEEDGDDDQEKYPKVRDVMFIFRGSNPINVK